MAVSNSYNPSSGLSVASNAANGIFNQLAQTQQLADLERQREWERGKQARDDARRSEIVKQSDKIFAEQEAMARANAADKNSKAFDKELTLNGSGNLLESAYKYNGNLMSKNDAGNYVYDGYGDDQIDNSQQSSALDVNAPITRRKNETDAQYAERSAKVKLFRQSAKDEVTLNSAVAAEKDAGLKEMLAKQSNYMDPRSLLTAITSDLERKGYTATEANSAAKRHVDAIFPTLPMDVVQAKIDALGKDPLLEASVYNKLLEVNGGNGSKSTNGATDGGSGQPETFAQKLAAEKFNSTSDNELQEFFASTGITEDTPTWSDKITDWGRNNVTKSDIHKMMLYSDDAGIPRSIMANILRANIADGQLIEGKQFASEETRNNLLKMAAETAERQGLLKTPGDSGVSGAQSANNAHLDTRETYVAARNQYDAQVDALLGLTQPTQSDPQSYARTGDRGTGISRNKLDTRPGDISKGLSLLQERADAEAAGASAGENPGGDSLLGGRGSEVGTVFDEVKALENMGVKSHTELQQLENLYKVYMQNSRGEVTPEITAITQRMNEIRTALSDQDNNVLRAQENQYKQDISGVSKDALLSSILTGETGGFASDTPAFKPLNGSITEELALENIDESTARYAVMPKSQLDTQLQYFTRMNTEAGNIEVEKIKSVMAQRGNGDSVYSATGMAGPDKILTPFTGLSEFTANRPIDGPVDTQLSEKIVNEYRGKSNSELDRIKQQALRGLQKPGLLGMDEKVLRARIDAINSLQNTGSPSGSVQTPTVPPTSPAGDKLLSPMEQQPPQPTTAPNTSRLLPPATVQEKPNLNDRADAAFDALDATPRDQGEGVQLGRILAKEFPKASPDFLAAAIAEAWELGIRNQKGLIAYIKSKIA